MRAQKLNGLRWRSGNLYSWQWFTKKDFTDTGVGCIHYGQIYTYYGTFTYETRSFTSSCLTSKLRKAKNGDLIIATTSENEADVRKAVAWLGSNEVVVGGDANISTLNSSKICCLLF